MSLFQLGFGFSGAMECIDEHHGERASF